jgi:predicted Rossmann fold flavoprotein
LQKSWDVIILGAGAAGLMCALTAARRGHSVLVLEKSNKVGKKILMSGGGRCNFTNLYIEPECFISQNPHYCKSALSRYSQWDFIDLVKQHQIPYHEKTLGQLFCDDSSKQILDMLLSECDTARVDVKVLADISSVTRHPDFRLIGTIQHSAVTFECESLVVACGGLSIPKLGGSDYGYKLAEQFGHRILPPRPGLVPFTFTDSFKLLSEKLSGISVAACVRVDKQSFDENILFSHRGLSGPAVLQISSYWQEGETVEINILPTHDVADLLLTGKLNQPGLLLRNMLAQYLPRKLVLELEQLWWPDIKNKPIVEIGDWQLNTIAEQFKSWQLKPAGTEGYRTAEVTLGGVDTNQLSSRTMMSKKIDKLFFIGEVVDVSGHLGGFNFQWAWSSGNAAGSHI